MAKTREDRRQFWREHVQAWRRSGDRRDDYCREHGLNEQTFNLWVGRLRDELRPGSNGASRTTDKALAMRQSTFSELHATAILARR